MVQVIYIGLAKDQHNNLLLLCWHTEKQRAGDVAKELAQQMGVKFLGVVNCDNADYEALSSFPDDHLLNQPPA